MGKTICEIKMELKAKGIKGITGLNKGQLEALLRTNGSAAPKKEPKKDKLYNKAENFLNKIDKAFTRSEGSAPPKFTPAATKGESPKVAEKKITKKEKVMKPLMITYKEPSEPKKETKAPPKIKRPKQTEDERFDMLTTKTQATKCLKLIKKAGIKNEAELKKYIIENHPDKKKYDPDSKEAILYKELSNCSTAFKNMKVYLAEGLIRGFKGLSDFYIKQRV